MRKHLLKREVDYEVGEKLVCRKYFKIKNAKLQVNFEYTIDSITGNNFYHC